jgi:VanZ family protein
MGRWRAWAPAVVWAVLLLAVSSRPSVPVDLDGGRDKVAHFLAYLVFGALLARAAGRRGAFLGAVAIGLAFAAVDELFQGLIPGRVPDVMDWVADAAGVLTGVLLYRLWRALADGAPWRRPAAEPDPSSP